jgi:hypothetical protein
MAYDMGLRLQTTSTLLPEMRYNRDFCCVLNADRVDTNEHRPKLGPFISKTCKELSVFVKDLLIQLGLI